MDSYEFPHGTTFQRDIEIDQSTGEDYSLTGSNLQFRVYDSDKRKNLVLNGSASVVDPNAGLAILAIPASATSSWTDYRVLYGLVTLASGGSTWSLMEFKLKVV